MTPCILCHEERPKTDFSTLTRLQSYESTSPACTTCYWKQLVLEYPELQSNGMVIYRPYSKPKTQYITQIKRWLPAWLLDKKVQNKYLSLGELSIQTRPFYEFVKGVLDENA